LAGKRERVDLESVYLPKNFLRLNQTKVRPVRPRTYRAKRGIQPVKSGTHAETFGPKPPALQLCPVRMYLHWLERPRLNLPAITHTR
jgi:hypothetical protein